MQFFFISNRHSFSDTDLKLYPQIHAASVSTTILRRLKVNEVFDGFDDISRQ